MCGCALCGRKVEYAGVFVLCDACRRQVCALEAQDRRYLWFAGAVKRAVIKKSLPF